MGLKVKCDWCRKEFLIKAYKLKKQHNKFCSRECYWKFKGRNRVQTICAQCGKELRLSKSLIRDLNFCSHSCARSYRNLHDNPMNDDARSSLSLLRMGSGEKKTYLKINGRHAHRSIAERILGRPLKKGEVVHHIDRKIRNNAPENLKVFESQAEHARWHMKERYGDNDEL